MNRSLLITFGFLPVFVIAGVVVLFAFGGRGAPAASGEGLDAELQRYREARQLLLEHYDGELNQGDLGDKALVGMAQATGDPYTRVNPPIEARQQAIDIAGRFYGINCRIDTNEDGSIRIVSVEAGGGGEKAGVLVDDVIVAVDGVSILGQTLESSRQRIQSERKDSVVRLDVLRGGDPARGDDPAARRLTLEVTRSPVVQHTVHDVHVVDWHGRRFGYMHVSDFHENTVDPQFTEAVAALASKGAEGFVIDLRGNGGGSVKVAVAMADALLDQPDAVVVFTHSSRESNRRHDYTWKTRDDTALTALPIVLLVDGGTASAAELFAGAMRDHGRAYLVGERTYGKGVVQTIFRLPSAPDYAVNITTTQYFTPLGRKVQRGSNGKPGGITPDLQVSYHPGERDTVRHRQLVRRARYNRDEIATTSRFWNVQDRMLEAALDVLAGRPVTLGPEK